MIGKSADAQCTLLYLVRDDEKVKLFDAVRRSYLRCSTYSPLRHLLLAKARKAWLYDSSSQRAGPSHALIINGHQEASTQ